MNICLSISCFATRTRNRKWCLMIKQGKWSWFRQSLSPTWVNILIWAAWLTKTRPSSRHQNSFLDFAVLCCLMLSGAVWFVRREMAMQLDWLLTPAGKRHARRSSARNHPGEDPCQRYHHHGGTTHVNAITIIDATELIVINVMKAWMSLILAICHGMKSGYTDTEEVEDLEEVRTWL